jgi:hypothetical protein
MKMYTCLRHSRSERVLLRSKLAGDVWKLSDHWFGSGLQWYVSRLVASGCFSLVLIRTAATIYKIDPTQDVCSADPNFQVEATIAKCYNTTWVYYSFDDCDIPASSTPNAATPHQDGSNHTAAIVGGIVGSFLALTGSGAGIFLYMRRKKTVSQKSANTHELDSNFRHELPSDDWTELSANPHLEMFCELGGSRPLSLKPEPIELPTEYHANGTWDARLHAATRSSSLR